MAQTATQSLAANLSGLSFRNNLNTILAALFSANSGPTAPSPTVGGQLWLDNGVSPPVLRMRNNANTAWVELTPETLAANTIWGNPNGSADKPQPITMTQLRAMVATATGQSLMTAADAAAARTALGATATGGALFTAASAAAAQIAMGAMPVPALVAFLGNVININVQGVNYALPAGGQWFYSYTGFTGAGVSYVQETGIQAGGTVIFPAQGTTNVARGWAIRIRE
jgi:hypothetical protein